MMQKPYFPIVLGALLSLTFNNVKSEVLGVELSGTIDSAGPTISSEFPAGAPWTATFFYQTETPGTAFPPTPSSVALLYEEAVLCFSGSFAGNEYSGEGGDIRVLDNFFDLNSASFDDNWFANITNLDGETFGLPAPRFVFSPGVIDPSEPSVLTSTSLGPPPDLTAQLNTTTLFLEFAGEDAVLLCPQLGPSNKICSSLESVSMNVITGGSCGPGSPPVAVAGEDFTKFVGETIVLTAKDSFDVEDAFEDLDFQWESVGAFIPVTDPFGNGVVGTANAGTVVATHTFRLTVTDTDGNQNSDDIQVTVLESGSGVFVSDALGDDANLGTAEFPVKTLQRAVEAANLTVPRSEIYVHEAVYSQDHIITVRDEMSMYGGFEAFRLQPGDTVTGWARTASGPTVITTTFPVAMEAVDISTPTTIDGFVIESADAPSGAADKSGFNSIGINVFRSGEALAITNNEINAGRGGAAGNGLTGTAGRTGNQGGNGDVLAPGVGAVLTSCGVFGGGPFTGGQGGDGGLGGIGSRNGKGGNIGFLGNGAGIFSSPGIGGTANGGAGQSGDAGNSGASGIGGTSSGVFDANGRWRGSRGGVGALGIPGGGGGGGAGDKGLDVGPAIIPGPGGGGGGSGGCPGFGGRGGAGGGASIGIYLSDSSPVIAANNITTIGGGGGGQGGEGGQGGLGGAGGFGPSYSGRTAGNGGLGGRGGAGGPGGGGGGGASCGVMIAPGSSLENSTATCTSCTSGSANLVTLGPGGPGGSGPVRAGQSGMSAAVCPQSFELGQPVIDLAASVLATELDFTSNVSSVSPLIRWVSSWEGSDIAMSLTSPSGQVFDRSTTASGFAHTLGPNYAIFAVSNPETGQWEGKLNAIEVPEEGELVSVSRVTLPANQPPTADAGPDIILEATGSDAAIASLDGQGSSDPDGDSLSFEWRDQGGQVIGSDPQVTVNLALGVHTVTLVVTDVNGASASDSADITVEDNNPPNIAEVTATPSTLWPPNHKMVRVDVSVSASDSNDLMPSCHIVGISSTEPENGLGDGDTSPDSEIVGPLSANIRAERSGSGPGRTYAINVDCSDSSGNVSQSNVQVSVSHNKSK